MHRDERPSGFQVLCGTRYVHKYIQTFLPYMILHEDCCVPSPIRPQRNPLVSQSPTTRSLLCPLGIRRRCHPCLPRLRGWLLNWTVEQATSCFFCLSAAATSSRAHPFPPMNRPLGPSIGRLPATRTRPPPGSPGKMDVTRMSDRVYCIGSPSSAQWSQPGESQPRRRDLPADLPLHEP